MVRHAILGVGGVGGLMAAALAKQGDAVTVVVRPEGVRDYPKKLSLKSPFGDVSVPVSVTAEIKDAFDVLWITVKATQLESSLKSVKEMDGIGAVVPLLNGVDHVKRLREIFGHDRVVPATISVEAERVAPGEIVHRSPFARLNVAEPGRNRLEVSLRKLSAFGFEFKFIDNEATLLWSKLAFLAPFALTTSASEMPIGGVRDDAYWRERLETAAREAADIAQASGATINRENILTTLMEFSHGARSSMQKDLATGLTPELDAIAGPIIRGGEAHRIPTPVTRELAEQIEAKVAVGHQRAG